MSSLNEPLLNSDEQLASQNIDSDTSTTTADADTTTYE